MGRHPAESFRRGQLSVPYVTLFLELDLLLEQRSRRGYRLWHL
jgi:hypothetical protein